MSQSVPAADALCMVVGESTHPPMSEAAFTGPANASDTKAGRDDPKQFTKEMTNLLRRVMATVLRAKCEIEGPSGLLTS